MDLKRVSLIVQYGVPDSLATLCQRFGRGARDPSITAKCILLAPIGVLHEDNTNQKDNAQHASKRRRIGKGKAVASAVDSLTVSDSVGSSDPPNWTSVDLSEGLFVRERETLPSDDSQQAIHEQDEAEEEYVPAAALPAGKAETPASRKRTRAPPPPPPPKIDPAVNDWINAATLPDDHRGCRNKVERDFFGLDRIGMLILPRNLSSHQFTHHYPTEPPPSCCPRCNLSSSTAGCCDLCTPIVMEGFFDAVDKAIPPPKTAYKKQTPPYQADERDKKLAETLNEWCLKKFIEQNGGEWDPFDLYGPDSFMTDKVLMRLVDLAHYNHVSTKEALAINVNWELIGEYNDELLELMKASRPVAPSPLSHTPPSIESPNAPLSSTSLNRLPPPVVKRVQRCTVCHQPGHNST